MRKRIYIGLVCFGIILVILFIYNASSPSFEESTEFEAPNDYKDIFCESARSKMKVDVCYNSSILKSFAIFDYGEDIKILVHKIGQTNGRLLTDVVRQSEYSQSRSFRNYFGHSIGRFSFYFLPDSTKMNGKYLVTIYGDSLASFLDKDKLIMYSAKFKKVELKESSTDYTDFYLEKNSIEMANYCSLLFVKRNGYVYLIFMYSPKNEGVSSRTSESLINED
jgi:hypothetical protein